MEMRFTLNFAERPILVNKKGLGSTARGKYSTFCFMCKDVVKAFDQLKPHPARTFSSNTIWK